jgi:signal transduction histidine kinase/HAMP domain-containing protein
MLVDLVARAPARVQVKLLAAFLAMVGLLILLGAVGLRVLSGVNRQTEELIDLQRKIAAYRQVQHDTTGQLYGVASALLSPTERVLEGTLRQLTQFGYDLDRLQYVARDEVELLGRVRQEYDRFIEIVTHVVELARAGQVAEAREVQLNEAGPLADRLERLTNQLVNLAESDMLAGIEASHRAYDTSRLAVIAFALGSILLALGLGYVISRSLVRPVTEIEARLQEVAAGDFSRRVRVVNRDELGALATNLNRTCEELGRLYRQIEERTRQLERSVGELRTLGEVSEAVNSSLELDRVLDGIAAHAASLAEADAAIVYDFNAADGVFHIRASHRLDPEVHERLAQRPMPLGQGAVGRAGAERRPVQIADIAAEPGYAARPLMLQAGYRAVLAVPLRRDETLIGALVLCRKEPGEFTLETVALIETLANQSVLAIQNARLFEAIERQGRELAAASRHKSEFLANMSHELRTPLNAILGYAELIQDGIYGEVPERICEVLDRIQSNGRHLLGLINDVLDLSKIEAGQLTLSPVEYSMRDVVRSVASATESLAAEKRLSLTLGVPEDLPPGQGDERRITQVLMNLVGNAIKFTDEGGVAVRVAAVDGAFHVEVADTGPGIAAEDCQKIFEEFRQVDSSSTRKKGGTGLGLAISRRLIELHGGRIWVESEPGRGSTFRFTVPVHPGLREVMV